MAGADRKRAGVQFVAADVPEANRLTILILAAVAEEERRRISERTKAALAAAKARGIKLGNPHLAKVRNVDTSKATAAKSAKATARNAEIREVIHELKVEADEQLSSRAIAGMLNEAGYTTSTGRPWHHQGVLRVLA